MVPKEKHQPGMDVRDLVLRTVSSHFGIRKSDPEYNPDLQNLGADLLDRIELMVTIEEEFAIHVPLNNIS